MWKWLSIPTPNLITSASAEMQLDLSKLPPPRCYWRCFLPPPSGSGFARRLAGHHTQAVRPPPRFSLQHMVAAGWDRGWEQLLWPIHPSLCRSRERMEQYDSATICAGNSQTVQLSIQLLSSWMVLPIVCEQIRLLFYLSLLLSLSLSLCA